MNRRSRHPLATRAPIRCFSLVEMMVSVAILSIILVLLVQMVDMTGKVWKSSSMESASFRESRASFESMSRKLSQVILNPYWDYDPPLSATQLSPSKYVRQSDLHLVCGPALGPKGLLTGTPGLFSPGHAVFFLAELGYSEPGAAPDGSVPLPGLLNAAGYYLSYEDTIPRLPKFARELKAGQQRNRFLLMEMCQPAEECRIFQYSGTALTAANAMDWFRVPLAASPPPSRVIAENIVALVFRPRTSLADSGAAPLSTDYVYDTRKYLSAPGETLSRNQLPPLIDITLVAIDEASATRLDQRYPNSAALPSMLQPGTLFNVMSDADYQADLKMLTDFLEKERFTYRVFTTTVSIRQARWNASAN
ncbi:hypothetical protein DB346_09390 [Verrucomicrobia bacterium LW23]|nr:hypothetical protein DB346_09390 [Verrucomicrobia bacterium LW23]